MMKKIIKPFCLTFVSTLLLSNLVFAQENLENDKATTSEEANYKKLEKIVVVGKVLFNDQINALKTPTPIIDVPQSLWITTEDQILQQGFFNIGDIVDYTPGVNNTQGEGHRDAVVFLSLIHI